MSEGGSEWVKEAESGVKVRTPQTGRKEREKERKTDFDYCMNSVNPAASGRGKDKAKERLGGGRARARVGGIVCMWKVL